MTAALREVMKGQQSIKRQSNNEANVAEEMASWCSPEEMIVTVR
jgi:hypothetical protein